MKRLCLISFSDIARDARVLRQVEYLSPHYDLTVIGHGDAPVLPPNVNFVRTPKFTALSKIVALLWLLLGKLVPCAYEGWYWTTARHRAAYQAALAARPDAIHANDWSALPVAAEAAHKTGARVVLDLHEYAPLQFGNRRLRRLLFSPAIIYMLRQYAARVDASMTVCAPIAERYRAEFGLDPFVVMNAPRQAASAAPHDLDPDCIRLVHHGGALRDRGLEIMIDALALAEPRFRLDFMLLPTDPAYYAELRTRAEQVAPGRVTFRDPVAPAQIVAALGDCDVGLCVIQATNYNYLMALPNKLFDFIAAGLAMVVGPSPAMAELVREHGLGVEAPTFDPQDIANSLNALTPESIARMQAAAREAARVLNADTEMGKVVDLYARLLDGEARHA